MLPDIPTIPSSWKRIGIVGMPPVAMVRFFHKRGMEIIDLDEPRGIITLDETASLIPRVYCAVLRTVILNALREQCLDGVVVDTGPGKCDGALYVADILSQLHLPVRTVTNLDSTRLGSSISESALPLPEKMSRITRSVLSPEGAALPAGATSPCHATAGFWGVPPHDFSLLSLFPDTTHIFGWARCMENKTPADHALERIINPAIPMVFFAQSFCAKTALARKLAGEHPKALMVDCDVRSGGSVRAKIEAFLELSGAGGAGMLPGS